MVPYLFGFVLLIILNIIIGGKIFDTLFAIYATFYCNYNWFNIMNNNVC